MSSKAPRPDRTADAPRRLQSVMEALALLARRGAWIEPAVAGDVLPAPEACIRLAGAPAPAAGLGHALLETLTREGLLAPLRGSGHFTISPKGRAMLRRRLSRAGAPARATETASPRAANGPDPAGIAPAINPSESPLGWLRRRTDKDGRPLIDDAQFQAGERLRADLHFAGLTPRVTTNWSAIPGSRRQGSAGGGAEQTDHALAARDRVNRALAAVGPELSGILVDVCGHLKGLEEIEDARGWAKRSAKVVLDLALTALARHYGYIAPPARGPDAGGRVRHWGAADYRPSADAWLAPQESAT